MDGEPRGAPSTQAPIPALVRLLLDSFIKTEQKIPTADPLILGGPPVIPHRDTPPYTPYGGGTHAHDSIVINLR